MISFNEYLLEKELQFGKKANPRFNQAVILAGAPGSGKSFVVKNLLSIEGKTFNVDDLKTGIIKLAQKSDKYQSGKDVSDEFYDYFDNDLANVNLKNPNDTEQVHFYVKGKGYIESQKRAFFNNAKNTKNKPNVIFDVTLKNIGDINYLFRSLEEGGYEPKNTHICWVCSNLRSMLKQNKARDRSVRDDILVNAYENVPRVIRKVIENSEEYRSMVDGDIWIVFNAGTDDLKIEFQKNDKHFAFVKDYCAIHIKEQGKPALSIEELMQKSPEKMKKLDSYTHGNF